MKKLLSVLACILVVLSFISCSKQTYCLTDTHTGKLYIGSATGEEGVAQRWGNYLDSKHGGNNKLIALYEQKGAEYFEKYFAYTLLEYFGLSNDQVAELCQTARTNNQVGWIVNDDDVRDFFTTILGDYCDEQTDDDIIWMLKKLSEQE